MNLNFYPDSTANTYLSPNTALSGDAHASFLLGVLDQRSTARGYPFQTMRVPFIGTFIHDDWKISRRLTLNLGLRHEWESGPYDDNDIFSRYLNLSVPNTAMQKSPPAIPADLLALSTPNYNGAWVFTDSNNRKAWTTQKSIFLPRVGAGHPRKRQDSGQYRLRAVCGAGCRGKRRAPAAPIRWPLAPGARVSARPPLRCRTSRGGRRHTWRIRSRRTRIPSSCRSARLSDLTRTWATHPTGPLRITTRKPTIA